MKFLFKILFFALCFHSTNLFSQAKDSILYSLEAQAIGTKRDVVPFWMRSNQYGSIPSSGISSTFVGGLYKAYSESNTKGYFDPDAKKFDWAYGLEGRANVGYKSDLKLIEGYIRAKYGAFQLSLGRSKEIIGLVDSSLSTGAFSLSGNALGIPKAEISIPKYTYVPLTNHLLAVKGGFAHGWFGKMGLYVNSDVFLVDRVKSYYHQKNLYVRIGKPDWNLNLYGGFNHQVMWGNEKEFYGDNFKLTNSQAFWYVITGRAYGGSFHGAPGIPRSKIGNQIGSIDQGISYKFDRLTITAYHQFFYDVGGLYYLNNVKDGIWGLVIEKNDDVNSFLNWDKMLFEIVNSKSQGGELDAKITPSGDENYYNNFYVDGWGYKGENLGNNLLTNRKYARSSLPSLMDEAVINNRVTALHFGVQGGEDFKFGYVAKLTYSINYGTYGSSPIGRGKKNSRIVLPPPYFPTVNQFSAYFKSIYKINRNLHAGFEVAGDVGELLNNSFGGMLYIKKTW